MSGTCHTLCVLAPRSGQALVEELLEVEELLLLELVESLLELELLLESLLEEELLSDDDVAGRVLDEPDRESVR